MKNVRIFEHKDGVQVKVIEGQNGNCYYISNDGFKTEKQIKKVSELDDELKEIKNQSKNKNNEK